MKIIKWTFVFAFAFIVAWILIFTFTQDPFRATVQAKVLWYRTPGIPIYAYVAGAFVIGLLLGLFAAAYYYLVAQAGIVRKARRIKALEAQLSEALEKVKVLQSSDDHHTTEKSENVSEDRTIDESDKPSE